MVGVVLNSGPGERDEEIWRCAREQIVARREGCAP